MNVNQRSYIIFLLVTQWRGRERLNTKVGKTVFSEDHHHGEECVSAQICTNSSSRQHIDKSFLIPQDTTKTSSVIFFSLFYLLQFIQEKCTYPLKYGFLFIFLNVDIVPGSFLTSLQNPSLSIDTRMLSILFFFVSNNLPF